MSLAKEMGEWKVFSNYVGGQYIYRIGRQLRADEPLHSGNIEYYGGYYYDKSKVKEVVNKLNRDDGEQ